MLCRIYAAAMLAAIAPLAQAADNGIYLGAGYAQSDYGLDNPLDADGFDDEDSGYKLIAGWRPLDNFGVELNYIDHGEARLPGSACVPLIGVPCPGDARLAAETLSGFAVGYIDFPVIDLFAKVGATSWKVDGRSAGFGFDDDDLDFAWGAGIQARFWSFGARLEYEQFPIVEDEELGTISLSVTYTFF
jgi:opacity protein-like surface antigen